MHPLVQSVELDFGKSIYGFEQYSLFRVEEVEESSSFCHVRSCEEPSIGFIVISPFDVYPEYEFQLNENLIEELGVDKADDVLVLSIVTVQKPFEKSTINLLAPLVINVKTGASRQVVLNGTNYTVNAPLLTSGNEGDL
ncbi:flagellar assembly protein FliW [Paenibacillus harenae]|uniref:Flagellar assembly factor FliW n=1 Tax=Paenibacillus harenae TaxID=306543 RepID=A0ABT9UA93_PAEHA|nr:flagellar assembly protein FliW [Paenibacillus harenae]MDQ0116555.1 flagellar assembly factor FliW [Paenibacillus harenae]